MEVILLKDVDKVGLRGEVVNVARGYARNFLLPRQLADVASAGRVAELEKVAAQRARHEAGDAKQAQEVANALEQAELRFDVKSGPTGSLFGSVTTTDIADRIWETLKIRVDRKKIGTDSIKRIGRYSIAIQIFENVSADVRTLVVPEGGELPPEEELAAMEAAEVAEATAAAEADSAPAADVEYLDEPAEDAQTPAEAALAADSPEPAGAESEQTSEAAATAPEAGEPENDEAPQR